MEVEIETSRVAGHRLHGRRGDSAARELSIRGVVDAPIQSRVKNGVGYGIRSTENRSVLGLKINIESDDVPLTMTRVLAEAGRIELANSDEVPVAGALDGCTITDPVKAEPKAIKTVSATLHKAPDNANMAMFESRFYL